VKPADPQRRPSGAGLYPDARTAPIHPEDIVDPSRASPSPSKLRNGQAIALTAGKPLSFRERSPLIAR